MRKIVIANWKMNPSSLKEAEKIVSGIGTGLKNIKKTEVVLCPPSIYLSKIKKTNKKIYFGAQNSFYEDSGAYTGEISIEMLKQFGVKYSIVGHSERRAFGETNKDTNLKIKKLLEFKITAILCIGESVRDEEHKYFDFIKKQIEEALEGINKNSLNKIIIAYEPIWAIGKNALREATAGEFLEMSIFIKKILSDIYGAKNIEDIRIIYGGSVHPENSLPFIIDGKSAGFLVGRDSLEPKKFLEIIKLTENLS